jgi:hypothetical protein
MVVLDAGEDAATVNLMDAQAYSALVGGQGG